jgi:hypothetical protein
MGALTSLLPLIILFTFVGAFAWIGYQVRTYSATLPFWSADAGLMFLIYLQIFLYTNTLAEHGKKHMEKGPITFSKEGGLKVNVKDVKREDYEDSTQSVLVKTWNLANESKSRPSSSRAS